MYINSKDLVENVLALFQDFGCDQSLKIPFLDSHLNSFPNKCGQVSDQHGESFHQDIAIMEKRSLRKWSTTTLANYCSILIIPTSVVIDRPKEIVHVHVYTFLKNTYALQKSHIQFILSLSCSAN
ncbi:uncharacterized protein TNCV_3608411 [Trichonephila clavipes]|nr:uncharacterized protein TNCV_3608411 [Trichonephila clavipes]